MLDETKNTVFILSVLILTCGSAHARIQTVNSQGQDVSRQETAQSTSQDIQKQASQWGLNAEDYQRYQQLMDGPAVCSHPGSIH